jgi:hypothetical protein
MIHSAQVFSPRPSADPAANLKVLQTPLKAMQSRMRSVSPDKKGGAKGSLMERLWEARADAEMAADAAGDGGEDIVLVDGNHPRVVQEEKDLVILEDVPIPIAPHLPNLHSQVNSAFPNRTFPPKCIPRHRAPPLAQLQNPNKSPNNTPPPTQPADPTNEPTALPAPSTPISLQLAISAQTRPYKSESA